MTLETSRAGGAAGAAAMLIGPCGNLVVKASDAMRTTDRFQTSMAAAAIFGDNGPLSRANRVYVRGTRDMGALAHAALPPQSAALARAGLLARDAAVTGGRGSAGAFDAVLPVAGRRPSWPLGEDPAVSRLLRAAASSPRAGRSYNALDRGTRGAAEVVPRGAADATVRAMLHLDAMPGGAAAAAPNGARGTCAWTGAGVAARLHERVREARAERELQARVREATRIIDGAPITARWSAIGGTLDSWQRAQLRDATRELSAARDAVGHVGPLARIAGVRLAEISRLLEADHAAARALSRIGAHPAHEMLSRTLPHLAGTGLLERSAVARVTADAHQLARAAGLADWRTRGWSAAAYPYGDGRFGSSSRSAAGLGVATLTAARGQELPWMQRSAAPSVADVLGFVVITDEPVDQDEPTVPELDTIGFVATVIMWSQYARLGRLAAGRSLTAGGRIVIAQTGEVLRELGVTVAGAAGSVAQDAWEGPLWALRAQRALSRVMTTGERRALAQRSREVAIALASATAMCVSIPPVFAAFSLLTAGSTVHSFYLELARLCHQHGLDELVPARLRHGR